MSALIRFFLGFSLVLTALFLILLVLIQRGRGGGLAGAFGGMGGQSAFGTKAGDVFTKITVGVAAFWILLCILAINVLGRQASLFNPSLGGAAPQATTPMTPPAGGPPVDMQPATPETKPVAPETQPVTPDATPADAATEAKPAAADAPAPPAAGTPPAPAAEAAPK